MRETYEVAQVLQDAVLQPDLASALGVFGASFLNELFAILPASVVLSGQLFFLKGSLSLQIFLELTLLVALPVGLGAAVGSLPTYLLAYFGGKPGIERYGKYVRLSWSQVEKMESKFKGSWYDEGIFLLMRTIPLLPALPVSVAAGILRMHFFPYFILTILGTILKMGIMFLFVGWGVEVLAQ